jgi:hypothetical protein
MHLSHYSIPNLLTGVGVASFGLFVLLRDPHKKLTRLFFWCAMSVAWWSFAYGLLYSAQTPEQALRFARIGYLGVVFIPTTFCHFVAEYLKASQKRFLTVCYVLSVFFLIVSRFDIFLKGVYTNYWWGYYPKAGPLYGAFILFFYGGFGTCVYYLLKVFLELKRSGVRGQKWNQVKYVLLAFCIASASISDYLPNYGIAVYPFAYLAATGWLITMAYGTLRYRVMDITLIIRKTIIYSAVVATLTALYLGVITVAAHLFEGFTGYQTVFSSAAAAAILSFCFQPLRKRVQTFVDMKFFRQYVDREEQLYELSREVITHTTPEAMGGALMRVLEEALHPKGGALFLRAPHGNGFVRVSRVGHSSLPEMMAEDNGLATYFKDHPQPFVQDPSVELGRSESTRLKEGREDAA